MAEPPRRALLSVRGLQRAAAAEMRELLRVHLAQAGALEVQLCVRADGTGGSALVDAVAKLLSQPAAAPSPRGEDQPFLPYFPVANDSERSLKT